MKKEENKYEGGKKIKMKASEYSFFQYIQVRNQIDCLKHY